MTVNEQMIANGKLLSEVLDDIKAEIEDFLDTQEQYDAGLRKALKIIDKYRSYSPCDDCKHEGSFGKEFDDTCIKCKSGSNRAESEG